MASLLGHLHFCSLKKCATSTGSNIGTHVYHEKTSGTGSIVEEPYSEQRRLWGEDRGVSWTPRNRRPEKLRDCLKELEDILQSCIVLDARWRTLRNIQIERVASTTIPVKAPVVVQRRNHSEDKLLLGCEDGTLMLYDDHIRVTQMTKANLDIHYLANDCGNYPLAEVAKQRAIQIDNEPLSSDN
ncbi:WD repeat-containing and planar cell polarity effector protein fritz homolog isoform X1 [Montipora capricornis]|uniref:WD repeat-containing and planar cell polarity effector protein fritz homolog isoform X1 n=1 Tax=Montipora capricornis TaxID=246305 RepID=UPI0035F12AFD